MKIFWCGGGEEGGGKDSGTQGGAGTYDVKWEDILRRLPPGVLCLGPVALFPPTNTTPEVRNGVEGLQGLVMARFAPGKRWVAGVQA